MPILDNHGAGIAEHKREINEAKLTSYQEGLMLGARLGRSKVGVDLFTRLAEAAVEYDEKLGVTTPHDDSPPVLLPMRPEWVRAIAKAASSLRFTANRWDWMAPSAAEESHEIAGILTAIENEYLRCKGS